MNEFTYRHIEHIAATYAKDKFMVVGEIANMLSKQVGKSSRVSKPVREDGTEKSSGRKVRGLPKWYRPKYKYGARRMTNVIDLDGPMMPLVPFLGKGAVKKWHRRGTLGEKNVEKFLEQCDGKGD